MLTSLAFVFLGGLVFATLAQKLELPRIIGMLLAGVIFGPYLLNLFDSSLLDNSAALRRMALIIILIKAGLTINLKDLKQVGRSALLMSFLPASFEILAYVVFAPLIFGLSYTDAALMGSVMAAVSPAVVVPRMVSLMDRGYGTKQGIPQMILAGASMDDIVVIVLFTSFLSMANGGAVNWLSFLNIPISIILGVVVGILCGLGALLLFKKAKGINPIQKIIIVLGLAFLLVGLEAWLEGKVAVSGLLAVMAMASVLKMRGPEEQSRALALSYGNIWIAAELLLFVLVGAAVDVRYLTSAGLPAIGMILLALIVRSIGVFLSVSGSHLTKKEKLFTVIAYLPKATVQAAIGSVPLAAGLDSGKLILSVAVIGIVLTAPLGAILIDASYEKLLDKEYHI